jgi:glyoxylate reductase
VNTSRGPVVDEAALVDALKEGVIAGAGLDVFENEPKLAPGLAECENAVLTPHIASASVPTREGMAKLAAENLIAFFEGRTPPNLVG